MDFFDYLLRRWPTILEMAIEHALVVLFAVAIAAVIGVALGVATYRRPVASSLVVAVCATILTIPSFAMFGLMLAWFGLGNGPAVVALVAYALLPIVRNTHAGLVQVPPGLREAAASLGLSRAVVLRRIELPLAAATIYAGIRTSAVINVGTATIAAFIGAGGFGERIVTGLALNDHAMLLAGAVPAAALAGGRTSSRW